MITEAKVLIPEKEWIVKSDNEKIGTVTKEKRGFSFFKKGQKISFYDLSEIENQLGIKIPKNKLLTKSQDYTDATSIYDFPCSSKPYEPIYNIKKRLPLFYKSSKSKSLYCAGYYVIRFQKRWVKSFCPKLITLERYDYQGPYKTENEIKQLLHVMNKS